MSVLVYVVNYDASDGSSQVRSDGAGWTIRRAYGPTSLDDVGYLDVFHSILASDDKLPNDFCSALDEAIAMDWEEVNDFVNPFGDRRGALFRSVWTIDFPRDTLYLGTSDTVSSVSLQATRVRLLTDSDLTPVESEETHHSDTPPGPYWEPQLHYSPRENSFLEQVLRDFSFTWRHVIRRQMNTSTFVKIAYAIIWISTLDLTLRERIGFQRNQEQRGRYVEVCDLPGWDTPEERVVEYGSSRFVISSDIGEGLEIVRCHTKERTIPGDKTSRESVYAIITPRMICLCQTSRDDLEYTKPEKLFETTSISEVAITMILWMTTCFRPECERTRIHTLPLEIQDRALRFASDSQVASAKLGCELSLGSPFSWNENGVRIGIAEFKRHRTEISPVESLLIFKGVRSGLSYQRELKYKE